jgi:hypothetical protein
MTKAYRVEADTPVDPYVLLWLALQAGNESVEATGDEPVMEKRPCDSSLFGVKWVEA